MAIDWSHLPRAVQDKICLNMSGNCGTKAKDTRGFVHDPATGFFVCANCRKPAPLVGVQECDLCSRPFVPQFYDKVLNKNFLGIACDECDPPKQTS